MRRKSNSGVIAAIVAVVLAIALVFACGIGSSWFTNSDFATWFNSWGKGEQPVEEQPVDEGGAIVGEGEQNGMKLMSAKIASANYEEYGISPMAESAYTFTAIITPSNATDKTVDWSVAFANPSSAWANGKTVTDYVTLTPTSDGALTANLECKQAFGEQIVVTVTSRQNTEAKSTATVDYAKRITAINRSMTSGGSVVFSLTAAGSSHLIDKGEAILNTSSQFVPVYSVGTVDDEFDYVYTYSYSTEFINALKSQGFSDVSTANVETALPTDSTMSYFGGSAPGCGAVGKDAFAVQMDAMFGTSGLYNKFSAALRSIGSNPIYTIKVVATGTYSSITATCDFTVSASDYNILVESVGISGSTSVII